MSKVKSITHQGLTIIYTDLSNSAIKEIIEGLKEALGVVGKLPPKSVFSVVNFEKARFNREVINLLREVSKKNEKFVIATAIIGLTSMTKLMAKSILLYGRRNAKVFDDFEDAKNWLVSESKKV